VDGIQPDLADRTAPDPGVGVASHRVAPVWSHTTPGSIEALQVVYKVAERCNINCTYCYYFNMGEDTALTRPANASHAVTESLARWIAQGCAELLIPRVNITFHGGEPAMIGLKAFGAACRTLREIIEPVAHLSLSIQTNGTLLDDHWVEAFIEHGVGVGISIDGMRADNDRFRLDKRGRSTFGSTEDAIVRLVAAHGRGGPLPSTISVLHPENDYRAIYRYLRALGVREMRFLLPDRNVDDADFVASGAAAFYGASLAEVFSEWLAEDDPTVQVRFFDQLLTHFRPNVDSARLVRRPRKTNQIVIARSDGTVAIDDSFIPALDWYADTPVYATATSTLRGFLGDPIFPEIEAISNGLPTACGDCRWRQMCRGGDLENRFSAKNGFDNPSVYCDAYKLMFQHVCDELVLNGYPGELVAAKFGHA
jgi:uncharacterized protein